ncbi:MAG: DUF255 domain-containing protein [Thermoanaerobaculia bacterium]
MSHSSDRTNRLSHESSPYLLLHAHNPVDWFPWGPEALAKAKAEDKPIFLSVGYSTCFWCHVMERESFSDPAIAGLMNEEFVNIKVDREERLDLDEIYMLATQLLTGQGGWPNSVFLTPELKPFFAGTYFPPIDSRGMPGFPTVLRSMIHAWKERRADVEQQGEELADSIRRHLTEIESFPGELPASGPADKAFASLRERFDATWGGFGGAPKFPTPSNLFHLLSFASPHPDEPSPPSAPSAEERADRSNIAVMMLTSSLDGMSRGGLYDQLAGGFHRYATDREWKIPHFEKMLYDNGLLLEVYARELERSGSAEAERIVRETAQFLASEMTAPEGAFWSAIDAETGGREGAYYVWTRDELDLALGTEGAAFLAPIFGFDGEPFFEENRFVLHLPRALDLRAKERRLTREELLADIAPLRAKLLAARFRRRRPATDDKILADWNGIAIGGLAVAGKILRDEAIVAQAARAADFVLENLRAADGVLLHSFRGGAGKIPAVISDYAFLIRGLLRLHEATGSSRYLENAVRLSDEQVRRLGSSNGGFYNVAEADDLLVRGKEIFDGALPAANGISAENFLDLAAATGEVRFRDLAERTLRAFAPIVDRHPEGAKTMALALARFARFPRASVGSRAGSVSNAGSLRSAAGGVAEPRFSVKGEGGNPGALDSAAQAVVKLTMRSAEHEEDGWIRVRLLVEVAEGWHLDADLQLEGFDLELDPAATTYPEPATISAPGTSLDQQAFLGEFEISARARASEPGKRMGELQLTYQACDDHRCLPPAHQAIEIPA